MVENIQSICINTTYVCAAGVGVAVVAYGVARGMKFLSGGVKCLAAASLAGTLIIGGMVVTSVHVAGAKTNDTQQVGGDTNQIENEKWRMENSGGRTTILHSPFSILHSASPITDDDIAQGWRVVSVSSNALEAATFTMPEGATVWENARDFGAGWGSWKIPFGGWCFTYGDVGWTNGFAWVEGYFRSRFNSRANEIRLLSDRLALCPAANWARYNLAASRAWSVTNDVGGLVVTFENAAIGDDPTKIASVQMELFPRTGEVALRYDLANVGDATYTAGLVVDGTNHFVEVGADTREVVFQRVHPQDWDMDGLPNSLDPEPRNPTAGVDYNQNDVWAMLAFPSNATEIAAVGFAAWAQQRAADPNRRLLALRVASKKGCCPVCLNFGNTQVMCDGTEEILFPIDCGARYPFSVSGGELTRVSVPGAALWDTTWFDGCEPREFCVGDVTVCQESASSGWLCRTADVEVDGLDGAHFFLDDSRTVTAVVTNCHADAYIDCTWTGGEGVTFSNRHSLETLVCWNVTNALAWATNHVDLVTTYEGGIAVTNHHGITVGPQTEPATEFTLGCQKVFFLNDADFLAPGKCPTNRPERIRPVTLRLVGARGTGGYVSIANEGAARAVLFQVEDGVTNRIDASTRIRLDVADDSFTRECVKTVYMSCPVLGRGTLRATWTPDEGSDLSDEAGYQVIEPIRKLVTTERFNGMGPILNPSRLVYGTNAILKVSVNLSGNDSFSRTNAVFSRVSGAGHVASQWRTGNDWYALVEATSNTGELVVEARFNDDELQPRFVLPIVEKRTLRLKVFVVDPPDYLANEGWTKALIQTQVKEANQVFSQAGVEFSLNDDDVFLGLPSKFYFIPYAQAYVDSEGKKHRRLSSLMKEMFRTYTHEDCIRVFCIGKFVDISANGANLPMGVTICRDHGRLTLAHELGHVLGLTDCYYSRKKKGSRKETVFLSRYASPVDEGDFSEKNGDWGSEHGRGFYSREDIKKEILRTFLMYGVGDDSRGDISDGSVRSLRVVDVINSNSVYRAQVGVRYFKKTDEEVYANEK